MSASEIAGIVTGAIGAATGLGGLVVAVISERRSARAQDSATDANAGRATLQESLERIADNHEREREQTEIFLATMQGLRPLAGFGRSQASPGPTVPRFRRSFPAFNLEIVGREVYRLRNVGSATATNVSVTVGRRPAGIPRRADGTFDLAPMASTDPFPIVSSFAEPAPGEVLVTCDQLSEPAVVPVPPRQG